MNDGLIILGEFSNIWHWKPKYKTKAHPNAAASRPDCVLLPGDNGPYAIKASFTIWEL